MQQGASNKKNTITSSMELLSIDIQLRPPTGDTIPAIDTTALEVLQPPMLTQVSAYAPFPAPLYDNHKNMAWQQAQTWAEIQRYDCKGEAFMYTPKQPSKEGLLPLAEGEGFSACVASAFGDDNTTSIQGLDDTNMRIAMFEGLAEQEAVAQFRAENKYLSCMASLQAGSISISGELRQDSRFAWHNRCEHEGTGFVSLLQYLRNLPRLDALATLARFVDMDFTHMYQLSSQIHVAESTGHQMVPVNNIPRAVFLSQSELVDGIAQLVNLHHILGNAGQIIGAVAMYSQNGRTFCLPATVGNGALCIGKYKPTAHFLNQDQMDKRPNDPVICCHDMRTALALRRLIKQIAPEYSPLVIVTAHLGTDLSVLPWSYFYGHEVVFVCAPTKWSMARVKAYEAQMRGAGARRFRIFPGFLLHSPPGCDLACEVAGATETEAKLLRTAIILSEAESVVHLIRRVVEDAISYEEFKAWGQNMGVFARPKDTKEIAHSEVSGLRVFNPNSVTACSQPLTLAEVTLRHILPHAATVMVHGLKNAGKSCVLFELMYSLITGKAAFGIIGNADPATKVLLADSETLAVDFSLRMKQFSLDAYIGKEFYPFRKAEVADQVEGPAVLTNPHFSGKIEEMIAQHSIHCQVIDNITTFFERGQAYQQNSVGRVLDWAAGLNAQGVTTVFAHHSLQDVKNPVHADMRGSKEFSIRAHTEMVVIGKEQLLEDGTLGTEAAQAHALLPGATLGLYFRYCKHAAVLEGHTFWLHLPLNSHNFMLLDITNGGGNVLSMGATPPTICAGKAPQGDLLVPLDEPEKTTEDLTLEERRVLDFVGQRGITQTGQVKDHLSCGDTHARQILKLLCEKGLLMNTGTGGKQGYMLVDNNTM